ncbi:hypothetical protein EUX98_g9178 [Antrodiella citrinella]|uniref:Uncharacterized protein n=1 Tax=Antrodiella citrinella TaxID=2447956 RepID=A0A4S4LX35_9APHY|nr:hypothetical protein EUX98_g9178 [Antrodiella citrinella]
MEVTQQRQVSEKIAAALGSSKGALSTGRRTTRQHEEPRADSPNEEVGEQSLTDIDVDNDDQQMVGPTLSRPDDSREESGEQLTDQDGRKAGELATIPSSATEDMPKHRVLIDLSSTVKPATRVASSRRSQNLKKKRKSLSPKMKRMPPSALKSILKKPDPKVKDAAGVVGVSGERQHRSVSPSEDSDMVDEDRVKQFDVASSAPEDDEDSNDNMATPNPFVSEGATATRLSFAATGDSDLEMGSDADDDTTKDTPSGPSLQRPRTLVSSSNPVIVPRQESTGGTKCMRESDLAESLPVSKKANSGMSVEGAHLDSASESAIPAVKTPAPKKKAAKPLSRTQLAEARGHLLELEQRSKQEQRQPAQGVSASGTITANAVSAVAVEPLKAREADDIYEMSHGNSAAERAEALASPKPPVTQKIHNYGVIAEATPMRPLKTRALAASAKSAAKIQRAQAANAPSATSNAATQETKLEDDVDVETKPEVIKGKYNVKILRKYASLPENIRSDPTEAWKLTFLLSLFAIIGITPDPFFIPDPVFLGILQVLATIIYPKIPPVVKESAIFHNASQRVSEYRTVFGTTAVSLVWKEQFDNDLHTLEERAIYAKAMLQNDRFLYGRAEGDDPKVERAWTLWANKQMVLEKMKVVARDKFFIQATPSVVRPENNPAQNQFSKDKYGAILSTRWLEDILDISDRKIAKICSKAQDLQRQKKRSVAGPTKAHPGVAHDAGLWGQQQTVARSSKPQRCIDTDSEED